jgi:hypothetical protein
MSNQAVLALGAASSGLAAGGEVLLGVIIPARLVHHLVRQILIPAWPSFPERKRVSSGGRRSSSRS